MIVTPLGVTIVSPATVNAQLPPASAARSTIDASRLHRRDGRFADQDRRFASGNERGGDRRRRWRRSARPSTHVAALAVRASAPSHSRRRLRRRRRDRTPKTSRRATGLCSLTAARTSYPLTTAPNRRAVAMACKPATPAPRTSTLAGGIVPAAVVSIGKNFGSSDAAQSARLYSPAMLLCDEKRIHRLRARDARNHLHRERRHAGAFQRFDVLRISQWIEKSDHDRARPQRLQYRCGRTSDRNQRSSASGIRLRPVVDQCRSGSRICSSGKDGCGAGAARIRDIGARTSRVWNRFRYECDSTFGGAASRGTATIIAPVIRPKSRDPKRSPTSLIWPIAKQRHYQHQMNAMMPAS